VFSWCFFSSQWCFWLLQRVVGWLEILILRCFQICWDLQDSWSWLTTTALESSYLFSVFRLLSRVVGCLDVWLSGCFQICCDLQDSLSRLNTTTLVMIDFPRVVPVFVPQSCLLDSDGPVTFVPRSEVSV
jgi:hypothetical protein